MSNKQKNMEKTIRDCLSQLFPRFDETYYDNHTPLTAPPCGLSGAELAYFAIQVCKRTGVELMLVATERNAFLTLDGIIEYVVRHSR